MVGVLGKNLLKLVAKIEEHIQVNARVAIRAAQCDCDWFNRRLRRPESERREAYVQNVQARLHRFERGHGGHATGVVRVELEGQVYLGLYGGHELVGVIGSEQTAHVLDADAVGAHVAEAARFGQIVFQVVNASAHPTTFADGVADGKLEMFSGVLYRRGRSFQVGFVVEGVEHAEDVNAVLGGAFDELIHNVVGVVAVSDEGLPAQQH